MHIISVITIYAVISKYNFSRIKLYFDIIMFIDVFSLNLLAQLIVFRKKERYYICQHPVLAGPFLCFLTNPDIGLI